MWQILGADEDLLNKQASGAYIKGTAIEKCFAGPEDVMPVGTRGTVLASVDVGDADADLKKNGARPVGFPDEIRYGYIVEWGGLAIPAFVMDFKIKPVEPDFKIN